MSIKAKFVLGQHGLDGDAFMVLHRLAVDHADKRGGQHTNGSCRDGSCDYGSAKCAAWTRLCSIVARNLREPGL